MHQRAATAAKRVRRLGGRAAFAISLLLMLAALLAACDWLGVTPYGGGPPTVNNVFSNISNGLSQ